MEKYTIYKLSNMQVVRHYQVLNSIAEIQLRRILNTELLRSIYEACDKSKGEIYFAIINMGSSSINNYL